MTIMPKGTRPLEELAAQIVVSSGGSYVCLDPGGGPQSLADFLLLDEGGRRTGLLEVTSVVDGNLNALINDLHGSKSTVLRHVPHSKLFWYLALDGRVVSLKKVRAEILPILEAIETLAPNGHNPGVTGWNVLEPDTRRHVLNNGLPQDLNDQLYRLHVLTVAAWARADESGTIAYSSVSSHTASFRRTRSITSVVNAELLKADNLKKLRAAHEGHRSELFVWLDDPEIRIDALHSHPKHPDAERSLPTDAPTLPSGVTAVWAAPTPTSDTEGVLWYSDGSGWQVREWSLS